MPIEKKLEPKFPLTILLQWFDISEQRMRRSNNAVLG